MPFKYDTIKNWPFETIRQTYTKRDTILYALGIGLANDPLNAAVLPYVYEGVDGGALKAFPTMAVVLAYPGFWLKDGNTGADWRKLLHGEQSLVVHNPLPAEGTVRSKNEIVEIIDKGPDKGAIIYQKRDVYDDDTDTLLCTLSMSAFCRGDGGCGGPSGPTPKPHALPDRAPDHSTDLATRDDQALIYRLSGDYNPLHADPAVGEAAGFGKPILHGLCSYGVAARALVSTLADMDASKLRRFDTRFSAPVFPGETIRTAMWNEGTSDDGNAVVGFRCTVVERDVVVLNNGLAHLAP